MTILANSAEARDIAYHLHPFTNLPALQKEGPLVVTRGRGVYVYDTNGTEYLEGMAGLWCAGLGFSEPRLVQAAVDQLSTLPFYHSFGGKVPDVAVDLAERLVALAPVPMSKALFSNSGSEANDTAIKLVWYYNNVLGRPQKKKIISRERAYHGVTIATASLTGMAYAQSLFDLPALDRVRHTGSPQHYHHAEPGESEEAFASRRAAELEQLILEEGPDTVAAFIAEPVMGAGGVIVPPATYFEKIQAVLRKYDVLMIADEVICGFGRTGNYWGSQTFGIRPDIMTMAKQLSAAYLPISALLVSEPIFQACNDGSAEVGVFGHGFTYTGHPVPAAVALEALRIYDELDIVGRVRRLAPRFQDGLRRFADHPLVGEVRGVGLVAAVELVEDKAAHRNFDPKRGVGAALVRHAQARGLITRSVPGDSITLCPPMIIEEAEIDLLLERLGGALDDTWAWLRAG